MDCKCFPLPPSLSFLYSLFVFSFFVLFHFLSHTPLSILSLCFFLFDVIKPYSYTTRLSLFLSLPHSSFLSLKLLFPLHLYLLPSFLIPLQLHSSVAPLKFSIISPNCTNTSIVTSNSTASVIVGGQSAWTHCVYYVMMETQYNYSAEPSVCPTQECITLQDSECLCCFIFLCVVLVL